MSPTAKPSAQGRLGKARTAFKSASEHTMTAEREGTNQLGVSLLNTALKRGLEGVARVQTQKDMEPNRETLSIEDMARLVRKALWEAGARE